MLLKRLTLAATIAGLAVLVCVITSSLEAQQPGQGGFGQGFGRGGFGGGFGGGGFGGGPLATLMRNDVQEELELLDDQKEQIRALTEKSRERMGELVRGRRGGDNNAGGNANFDELRETMRKVNEEMQAEIDKILLPHQSKRLKQLEAQLRMRGGVMALGGMAEQLGISEEQMDKLREKSRGLEEELRKKTAELRKQMNEQLMAELTDEQRKQITELIGEPFEFRDEPPQFGGGGAGRGRPDGNENRGGDRRRRPDEEK